MKKYLVTLVLIIGYYNGDYDSPCFKYEEYEVNADDEAEAKHIGKQLDESKFSVYESYAMEL